MLAMMTSLKDQAEQSGGRGAGTWSLAVNPARLGTRPEDFSAYQPAGLLLAIQHPEGAGDDASQRATSSHASQHVPR
jgi:hypothetical protein